MTYLKQKPGSIEELIQEKVYYRDNLWEVTARVTHFAFGLKNSLITVEVEASNKNDAIRGFKKYYKKYDGTISGSIKAERAKQLPYGQHSLRSRITKRMQGF